MRVIWPSRYNLQIPNFVALSALELSLQPIWKEAKDLHSEIQSLHLLNAKRGRSKSTSTSLSKIAKEGGANMRGVHQVGDLVDVNDKDGNWVRTL